MQPFRAKKDEELALACVIETFVFANYRGEKGGRTCVLLKVLISLYFVCGQKGCHLELISTAVHLNNVAQVPALQWN